MCCALSSRWLCHAAFVVVAFVVVSAVLPLRGATAQQAPAAGLAFQGVTVIDVTTGKLLPGQTVVITGSRIRAIGSARTLRLPPGAQVVDAWGKYLMPGLWDMHTHNYGASGWESFTSQRYVFPLLLANGVTGFRDMGTGANVPLDSLRRWRHEVVAGTRIGPPRQLLAGRSLENEEESDHVALEEAEARARHFVDSLKAAGADFIKLRNDRAPPAVFYAAVQEARRMGIPFLGHLPAVPIAEASDSGMRTIEHTSGMFKVCVNNVWPVQPEDSASVTKCTQLAARFRRNGTWSVLGPFVGSYYPARLTEEEMLRRHRYWWHAATASARAHWDSTFIDRMKQREEWSPNFLTIIQQSHLPIMLGTDWGPGPTPVVGGFDLHDMLAVAVEHGLAPLTALQAVTLNPAQYLHATDSLGTVAPGKLADLVLLDANPLADIYNTLRIRAVVANGRYFDRAALDGLLRQAETEAAAACSIPRERENC